MRTKKDRETAINPKHVLLRQAAIPGKWEGQAIFAKGPNEDVDGGCTFLHMTSCEIRDDENFGKNPRRHVMVDTGMFFVGDGHEILQLGRKYTWHRAISKIVHPAMRVFSSEREIRAKLSGGPSKSIVAGSDSLPTEIETLLRDLAIMQLSVLERPMGLIDGVGMLFRTEVGDGNYPLRLNLDDKGRVVAFTLDLWPMVDEM